jgi:hypothetical protein
MHLPPSAEALDTPLARFRTGKGPAAVAFDGRAFQSWCEAWGREAYRVAKPSTYLLAFGGTRTVHRMTVALEDAGWIIRDMLVWGYASGFPKSKASLKPAWEPIVMARKPGPLRMLAIDECRIPSEPITTATTKETGVMSSKYQREQGYRPNWHRQDERLEWESHTSGRWPANIVLTDPIFDGGVEGVVGGGETTSGGTPPRRIPRDDGYGGGWSGSPETDGIGGSSGTYSRFFLIPKAARNDREPVLYRYGTQADPLANTMTDDQPPARVVSVWGGDEDDLSPGKKSTIPRANIHPTVKPTDLMRHLVRLVTPTGGIVLDPFLGSGTTALAAEMEGFEWIGIEREAEYVAIAEARLNGTQRGLGLGA